MWRGERCYCWHSIELAINFLDGVLPNDIDITHIPKTMKRFYQTDILKELGLENLDYSEVQLELIAKMHSSIWENYGDQLFELFDLRRPALWARYDSFIKEFYSIKGSIPGLSPSLVHIC